MERVLFSRTDKTYDLVKNSVGIVSAPQTKSNANKSRQRFHYYLNTKPNILKFIASSDKYRKTAEQFVFYYIYTVVVLRKKLLKRNGHVWLYIKYAVRVRQPTYAESC